MFGKKSNKPDEAPNRRGQQVERQPLEQYAFRRNRTITGSSSANIVSSNELNADIKSPRAHIHHLSSLRRKLVGGLLGTVVFAGLLYGLVTQLVADTVIQVANVPLVRDEQADSYKKAFETYYAARPTERLRFLLNERELLLHVRATHPEVKALKVQPGGSIGEASVTITPRVPIARWAINGENRYVDAEGVVFRTNYGTIPKLQIVDNSGIRSVNGEAIASNRFLSFVGRVVAESQRRSLEVSKVTIPTLTTRQLAVKLADEPTRYKLSVDRGVAPQVEDIARIDRYFDERRQSPGYVDVRVEGKAFYK